MVVTVARFEGVIERKTEELQGHRDAALRCVADAYLSGDSDRFEKASAVFDAAGPTMEGLVDLRDIDSIAVDSLAELLGNVHIARMDLEHPSLMSNN